MLTLVLYGLLAIAVMAVLFLLATRLLPAGEQIAPPVRDDAPWTLPPDQPLSAADIASVRLPVALRGYRFAETDLLLDRLGEELRARDEEIARLRDAGAERPASAEVFTALEEPRADAAARDHAEPDAEPDAN